MSELLHSREESKGVSLLTLRSRNSPGYVVADSLIARKFMNPEKLQSMEKISFKKAGPDDWERYRELHLSGLKTDPQAFGRSFEVESVEKEEYWRERLSNPNRLTYIAQEGEKFISTATAKKESEDMYSVAAVYTLPEFRGKGLSKALMETIYTEAVNNGAKSVQLTVNKDQQAAVGMYESLGFKIIGQQQLSFGDGKIAEGYLMEKSIL